MRMNMEHKEEYDASLEALADASKELTGYLENVRNKTNDEDRIHYITEIEGQLLERHSDALARYHTASNNFFGKD